MLRNNFNFKKDVCGIAKFSAFVLISLLCGELLSRCGSIQKNIFVSEGGGNIDQNEPLRLSPG